jgi:ATP-dependent DNA helicase PIF1
MLLSEARERDFVGNTVPSEMGQAELRLEELSEGTVRQAESMGWSGETETWLD